MRIAFLDPLGWPYTADTPYERPLGGTQSALCYLTAALADTGHDVVVFNGVTAPIESRGVSFRHFDELRAAGRLKGFDALVVLNAAIGAPLRNDIGLEPPLVLWTGHAHDQPAVERLKLAEECAAWAGFAFVSNWQRDRYEAGFAIPHARTNVLRNAVAPAFATLALEARAPAPWFATGAPPTLVYTSTPFRGLEVLLAAFPIIRGAISDARMRVFSSMGVYQMPAADDPYRVLYEHCRSLDGATYEGALGQARLAAELTDAAALAYPSTFAETSCIAVLEAMAAGAAVITTRSGALPETTSGFASLVDWTGDPTVLVKSFAAATIEALREMRARPDAAANLRRASIAHIRENYLWPARAKEWAAWISEISAAARA
jgi:glycosyltransferase involved in cell wall biosynthesis